MIFQLNPLTISSSRFRAPVYGAVFPPLKDFLIALGLTAVVLAAGLIVFYRYEKEFVFHLS